MIRSPWRGRSGDIGAWRTRCTGSWTSPSARTTAGCGTAPPRATSPSCARSPSTWSPRTAAAGPAYAAGASRPPGTTTTCSSSSSATLMREPWGAGRGESAFPQVRFVALVENGTNVLFGARLGPYEEGETTLARDALPALRPGMLCLADRQFFGHALWREAAATGADLLWRVRRNLRLPREARLADGSFLTTVH